MSNFKFHVKICAKNNGIVSKYIYAWIFCCGCAASALHASLPHVNLSLRLCRKTKRERTTIEMYESAFLCTFFVTAVPQLFFYMRQSRMKTYVCGCIKYMFTALPQNKHRTKMHLDTSLILIRLQLYEKIPKPPYAFVIC